MLQQTQVATVIPYWERFLTRFPDVTTLAAADEREVLKLWEGLGYYRRARQLHAAAQLIVKEHDGRFPKAYEAVRALPGIGRYTAGAILSIGLDQRLPILEANTIRVLSRLTAYAGDPASTAGQKQLWAVAEAILPVKRCGAFNQALMELGSEVCTPRSPACDRCPAAALCEARERGLVEQIPRGYEILQPPQRLAEVDHGDRIACRPHCQDRLIQQGLRRRRTPSHDQDVGDAEGNLEGLGAMTDQAPGPFGDRQRRRGTEVADHAGQLEREQHGCSTRVQRFYPRGCFLQRDRPAAFSPVGNLRQAVLRVG
jgi:A/G-specific adenine glycosylase